LGIQESSHEPAEPKREENRQVCRSIAPELTCQVL
jgi:hypothetical protein